MIPSISTFHFGDAVSEIAAYQLELATQVLPWLILAGVAAVVGGFAIYKIASAIMERELRKAAKPAIER